MKLTIKTAFSTLAIVLSGVTSASSQTGNLLHLQMTLSQRCCEVMSSADLN